MYQLSLYALSGVDNKKARIIYPSSCKEAKLQRIDIRNVVTGVGIGRVDLQPVDIHKMLIVIDGREWDKKKYLMTKIL